MATLSANDNEEEKIRSRWRADTERHDDAGDDVFQAFT